MADPVLVSCTANTWIKVATGVTTCRLWFIGGPPERYLLTHVDTTNPAPVGNTLAVEAPHQGDNFSTPVKDFTFAAAADLYVKAVGATGSVRVDL